MSSPRWLVRLTIPVMAGAALAGSAADCGCHSQPRCRISREAERRRSDVAASMRMRRSSGRRTSSATTSPGVGSHSTIADDIHDHLNKRGVTLLDVGTMVDAAHKTYCPGNVCDAPTLCT